MGIDTFRWLVNEAALHDLLVLLSMPLLLFIVALCIAVLSFGADWMIEGVVGLAIRTGFPTIVIGATIISLGTTMPEAFVSVMAAYMGNPGLALGNGVGSIIADTGLIFGLTCVLATLPVNKFILNRTGWIQIGSAVLLVLLSLLALAVATEGSLPKLQRWMGFFLLGLLLCYLYLTYFWARQSHYEITKILETPEPTVAKRLWLSWVMIIGGLLAVIASARVLVPTASEVAVRLGVPDDVIAATLVAFGTSLPELVTAISAIRKGHPEITVGNIVGADVLNVLFVIGAAAAATPLEIPPNFFLFHFPAMLIILISFRLFISMNKSGSFQRWQGGWLLGIYGVYVFLQYALNLGTK